MILDTLEHAGLYAAMLPRLRTALDFLRAASTAELPDGRQNLDGDRMFALVQSYRTRTPAGGQLETHRRYADVQCLLSGRELCGYAPLTDALRPAKPYDAAADIAFYDGVCDWITLSPGRFAVLMPQDSHMPGRCGAEGPSQVRKVVIKILL
ncbi:MAG: YhcH/YjgK/YiaL family protein [Kiritimatiellae bacterium]|nr:YhcH/YjgK/YiaL family protein [Kiritimatiellia bacterium]